MTLAIIQARLGSSRLPGKALHYIAGQRLIDHVIRRVRAIRGVAGIVLATPATDGSLLPIAGDWMAPDVQENDVLGRFEAVLSRYDVDTVMRLTGDCPLLATDLAEAVLELFRTTPGCEYATNATPGYVDGTDVEVMPRSWVLRAAKETALDSDREHVTPYIRRTATVTAILPPEADFSRHKWSVDTSEDLAVVRSIALHLPAHDYRFQTTLGVAESL